MARNETKTDQLTASPGTVLHATIDVARRVERAEIGFCALAGATHGRVESLDAGGGRALFTRAGSPLNKVLGVGLDGPVTDAHLDSIEAFYQARNAPAQIEVCPLAYGDLTARLCRRGYILEAFENELGMLVGPGGGPRFTGAVSVIKATPDQDQLWTRIVSEGFVAFEPLVGGAPEAAPPTTEQMIEMMSQFEHPNIRRYVAWVEGEPAGGGAAWAHEGVLGIFGTSTLARFRRRGVQAAITIRAMQDAEGEIDLAIATTAPGSTSQRTFERLGFRVLYTRAVFVKS